MNPLLDFSSRGDESSVREEKKKKKNMQSVLLMFVAGLYPGFQQLSENPTHHFLCVLTHVCVCWKGVTALLIVEAEQCCFKQLCVF